MPRVFTWLPPQGGTPLVLNDRPSGYRLMQNGTTGLHAPTYRFSSDQYAGTDGETLQALTADRRIITLGLQIEAPDEATFRQRWRALTRAMRPKAGNGRLEVRDEFGATRTLTCRYMSGLEGDGTDMFDGTQGMAVAKLVAFDPWWWGPSVTVSFGLAAPSVFLSSTLPFPRMLSASTIQGGQGIDLTASDTPSYPVWTVTGPGSSLTLTNVTTGRVIRVNAALGDGQTMVIDTRPGMQSVRSGDGTNLMGTLATDPALWPLIEGVNEVTAVLGNAGDASRVLATYSPRYAGI